MTNEIILKSLRKHCKEAAIEIHIHNEVHSKSEHNAVLITKTLEDVEYLLNKIADGSLTVVARTENKSDVAFCDEFVCNACGVHLKDWTRVVEYSDDNPPDVTYSEYEFKYCPECGFRIVEGE